MVRQWGSASPPWFVRSAALGTPLLSPDLLCIFSGAHFFCETLDVTRPFPSDHSVYQPSWEFVWNRWLSTSWRSIGLDHICPPLLQV